jgi:ABC-type sugar transport system ATPase subunit
MTARENVTLPVLERLARWGGGIRAARERSLASRYCDRLRVRAAGLDAGAGGLSGGNQQKLVIARWMAAECPVLLMDEPTRGVDVGAKAEIHGLIDELANQGAAVLLVSSELPELMNLCTRILVMRRGRLVARLARREATPERLLRLMAGVEERPPADAVRPRDAASPRRS